jgi:hypothetical protein
VTAALRGHVGPIVHAVFSPDGRRAITTSIDGTARLWEVDSGVELVMLGGESELTREPNRFEPEKPSSGFFPDLSFLNHAIVHAGFSDDGRQAFTLQRTGRIRIFDILTREELLANAREFARRPLNAEERRTYFLSVEETGTSFPEP